MFVANIRPPKYIKQVAVVKREINPNAIIMGDFKTALSSIDNLYIKSIKIHHELKHTVE